MTAEDFGIRLKELLQEREMTLRKFSNETDIDKGTISRIINGKRQANIQHLNKFSDCLNVPFTELLQAAGYNTDSSEEDSSSDLSESTDEVYQTLIDSSFYNNDFSVDEVRQKLKQYEQYVETEEGQQTIYEQFNHKIEKVGSIGPFIDYLKSFYNHFEERKVSRYKLAIMGSALLYFIVPVDVIPDYIFPIGYMDDAVAVKIALKLIAS